MKALEGAFNQEKALVGAFSVIVQLHRLIDLRHYPGEGLADGDLLALLHAGHRVHLAASLRGAGPDTAGRVDLYLLFLLQDLLLHLEQTCKRCHLLDVENGELEITLLSIPNIINHR